MAHRVSVKARLCSSHGHDEVRRFALPANPSWEACRAMLHARFGPSQFTVLYVDPEEDEITVREESDWQECLRVQEGPLLRLVLRPQVGRPRGKTKAPAEALTNMPAEAPAEASAEAPAEVLPQSLMPVAPGDAPPKQPASTSASEEAAVPATPESVVSASADGLSPSTPIVLPPSKTAGQLGAEALHLLDAGEYTDALQLLRQACSVQVLAHNVYNMACCHALLKHKAQALACLKEAVQRGYWNWRHMQADTDLKFLRGEPQFQALLQRLQEAEAAHWQTLLTGPMPPTINTMTAVASLPSSAPASLSGTEPPTSSTSWTPCPTIADDVLCEARRHARAGCKFQALKELRKCLAAGQLYGWMLEDSDFCNLRSERQFLEILSLARAQC